MGVLNITPDSFSDGGLWLNAEAATHHAMAMFEAGADVVDIGAESTRPGGGVYGDGADPVSAQEEADRLLPVLAMVRAETESLISVDTRKGVIARQALEAGADLLNDISGLEDASLAEAAAESGCPVILMHSRGTLDTMQSQIHFEDVVQDVTDDLGASIERASTSGLPLGQIILDPGIGFGKTPAHNFRLLRELDELGTMGRPILVGASRKSFLGSVTGAAPNQRLPESLAAAAWATAGGSALLRVHDVAETVAFLRIWETIRDAEQQS